MYSIPTPDTIRSTFELFVSFPPISDEMRGFRGVVLRSSFSVAKVGGGLKLDSVG